MSTILKIGLIGLDTSHAPAFAGLLNDPGSEFHVPGGRVIAAFPGGSPDFELSISRVARFTDEVRDRYGVNIVDSPEDVAEQCDAIMLLSVDGRVHLEQFKKIASYRKPVFVDKPFAVNRADAEEIVAVAAECRIPVMSCSALRYADALSRALEDDADRGAIIGADFYGPMELQPTQPGLFWYGIHTVDMLYRTLGKGCVQVTASSNEDHDVIAGIWADGRVGTIRGNRKGNKTFGGLVHRESGTGFVDAAANSKPYYASLLERVIEMFTTGRTPIDPQETLEVVRFIEAANESRRSGKTVSL